jgi:hypothetical protein
MLHARAVHRVACGEVIRAVEHHIALRRELVQLLCFHACGHRHHVHIGIHRAQRARRGKDLLRTDRIGAIEDLALQVGEVDLVAIGEAQLADACCRQVERCGAAQTAGADDEDLGGTQLLLPLDADLVEEDVPAVSEELLVVYRPRRSR